MNVCCSNCFTFWPFYNTFIGLTNIYRISNWGYPSSDFFIVFFSFRRYFGIVISHFQLALYTARRDEMIEAVQNTMFYMNPIHPIPVHSTYTTQPYEVHLLCLVCRYSFWWVYVLNADSKGVECNMRPFAILVSLILSNLSWPILLRLCP